MAELDLDLSAHRSKDLREFLGQSFDYVIAVCDQARYNYPTFPGDINAQRLVFRRVRNEINERIRVWVTVQRKLLKQAGEIG